ncbi:MAG: ABC transporter permease [Emergencia sp.]
MNNSFAVKLAVNNIRNNRKFYLPYFLASTGIIAMFYIIAFLSMSGDIREMSGTLAVIMSLGTIVMGIFSVIFLFYISSFLMKRRKKEIGLYNILGMEKRHIGRILAMESLFVSAASIAAGLFCGILFSKLIHTVISRVFGMEPPFGMQISVSAMLITLALFAAIFLACLLFSQMSIRLSKPVELLTESSAGEKEPRTRWPLAIAGFLCLGTGYYIAIVTESPLEAVFMFFVAVILVIIGTYCLFTAGSIAILKALRRNRNFYYKPANFTAVSGLIYRMKQNAVGLANICILSTMVLVMISGTVSLYAGMNDAVETRVRGDIGVSAVSMEEGPDAARAEAVIRNTAEKENVEITDICSYRYLMFTALKKGDDFELSRFNDQNLSDAGTFVILTAEDYKSLTGKELSLKRNEAGVYVRGAELGEHFTLCQTDFHVVRELGRFDSIANSEAFMTDLYYVVVSDDEVLRDIYQKQAEAYGDNASSIRWQFDIFTDGTDEQIDRLAVQLTDDLGEPGAIGSYYSLRVESRPDIMEMYQGLVGGFLFLGLFLGLVFTFAAALIIYYKQISEGYYDKDKFEIMQKVGMSKTEVKQTIRRQVLMVFFVPLVMAGIHVLAAFRMITRLLLIFSMNNVPLFALCTVCTFLAFAVIYALVYMVTAREYYKIVG